MFSVVPMRYERAKHAAATTDDYVFAQLIPYIGNKRKLLGLIGRAIDSTGIAPGARVVDFFAGSGVVSRYLKRRGFGVTCNDWEPYARAINGAWIACDAPPAFDVLGGYAKAIEQLNALPPREDWVTANLCPRDDDAIDPARDRCFYTRVNGMRIDAIREQIATWERDGTIDERERDCLLAPLLYAACYIANTSGVFKGFHAGWGGATKTALYRIKSRLRLRGAHFLRGEPASRVTQSDATELARSLPSVELAYLDPPYNQHPYASNYHVLNSIALWDKPAVSATITRGTKSAIRDDWRTSRRSPYNHRGDATRAFGKLIDTIDARWILTSYSTDGQIELGSLLETCIARGHTTLLAEPYKRYRVSAQRYSAKAMNVEFVVVTDTTRRHAGDSTATLASRVRSLESSASVVARASGTCEMIA